MDTFIDEDYWKTQKQSFRFTPTWILLNVDVNDHHLKISWAYSIAIADASKHCLLIGAECALICNYRWTLRLIKL